MTVPKTKLDPKDAALIAFIETIGNTGGIRRNEEGFSCVAEDEPGPWIDLADAYLLACKATGAMPIIDDGFSSDLARWQDEVSSGKTVLGFKDWGEQRAFRLQHALTTPILSVNIYVDRTVEDSISDEQNDAETAVVHALAATFPESIRKVRVCDREGEFLYFADQREGT